MESFQSALGLIVLTGLAWALSENRKAVRIKVVLTGITIQVTIAFLLLKLPLLKQTFATLNNVVLTLQDATELSERVQSYCEACHDRFVTP